MTREVRAGSRVHRNQLHVELRELGFDGAALTRAVAQRLIAEGGLRSRAAWRIAAGLSLNAAAARYNELSGDPAAPMRGARIWDYEQWPERGVRPGEKALDLLARAYGGQWVDLVDHDDLRALDPDQRTVFHRARSAAPVGSASDGVGVTLGRVVNDGRRTPGDPIHTESELVIASRSAARIIEFATSNVADVDLEEFEEIVRSFSLDYLRADPHSLLIPAAALQHRLLAAIAGRQRPSHTSKLYALHAKCSAILSWIFEDLGQHLAAIEQADAAWVSADYSDDDGARQWVRVIQSRLAFWSNRYEHSAKLAHDGGRYDGDTGTHAFLALLEARAWAFAGHAPQTRQALEVWERGGHQDIAYDQSTSLFEQHQDRQYYMVGSALLELGELDHALGALTTSLEVQQELPCDSRFYGTGLLAHVDVARVRLRRADLDGVAANLEPVLSANPSHRVTMVQRGLERLGGELAGATHLAGAQATDLLDRIRALRTSAPSGTG